jgi:uncharacterized membrane protein YbaN (DUF454 family)
MSATIKQASSTINGFYASLKRHKLFGYFISHYLPIRPLAFVRKIKSHMYVDYFKCFVEADSTNIGSNFLFNAVVLNNQISRIKSGGNLNNRTFIATYISDYYTNYKKEHGVSRNYLNYAVQYGTITAIIGCLIFTYLLCSILTIQYAVIISLIWLFTIIFYRFKA